MKDYIVETIKKEGQEVLLKGWVNKKREMGKVAFVDLRDSTGLVQVVLVPAELDEESKGLISKIGLEYVLEIHGVVQKRGEKQVNKNLATGGIEILAKKVSILNESKVPPFDVFSEERQAAEETRLEHRYLDLRHERMSKNLQIRHKVLLFLRNYLSNKGFTEVQTPILSKSTPEGARDYLVPSRLHQGRFFALPQSPQQYKQILMVSGIERYFQIAPCFRDEDARADRSPGEFYQLDLEMSFVTQEEILQLMETLFTKMVEELFPEKKITQAPWPRLTHAEAMEKYKSDKPDLRKNKEDDNELAFAWVLDFPLFAEQTEEDYFHGAGDKWGPSHHMFTAPKEEDIPLLDTDPGKVKSYQHDLVLNGYELGGGSVRIHDPKLQEKIFDLIGFTKEQKGHFQHLLKAFEYGVPPHGGIAPGIERLIMILAGEKNLREITPFPLTGDGRDPLMGAPSEVEGKQLDELGLKLKASEAPKAAKASEGKAV